MCPSHVAILVPSVRKAADSLRRFNFTIGQVESFEETHEIYIQGNERNSLLLMEPKDSGSYCRALDKRGPGLHHLAIDVLNLEDFLISLSGSGWLLHLNSLNSIKDYRTAYLARPGFPSLIEVQEKKKIIDGPDFVESVFLNFEIEFEKLVKAIGLSHMLKRTAEEPFITVRGQKIILKDLF